MPNSRTSNAASEPYLKALDEKRAVLSSKIAREQKHPAADPMQLRRWKAERLKLKDEKELQKKLLS